jgi:DNA-binding NarL/FixJ family response regulator
MVTTKSAVWRTEQRGPVTAGGSLLEGARRVSIDLMDEVCGDAIREAQRPVRAVIIDDHDVVHAGVQAWCAGAEPSIEFVGNYLEPREFIQRYPSASADVDVVLFDLQIDGNKPAFDTVRELCKKGFRVVIYSHITADEIILNCLDLGAITYLTKSEGRAHLIEAIHAASSATPYLSPRMARALLNDNDARRPNLSEREKEVLVAWFQTESKDLVGKRLYIAPSTVRTHLQRARAKYAAIGRPAPTKSALLARAIEDGILSLSDL